MVKNISKRSNASLPKVIDRKLKSCDPYIKKYLVKLETNMTNLELENSNLRVDNKRFQILVKALEYKLSKCTPSHEDHIEQMEKMKEQAIKDALKNLKGSK